MAADALSLVRLGWNSAFAAALTPEQASDFTLARVFGAQRTGLLVRDTQGLLEISLAGRWFQLSVEQRPTVGDWVLLSGSTLHKPTIEYLVPRQSLLKRVIAGTSGDVQLLGANVDTLFIVTSANDEFNPRRLERYLAFAYAASVQPVLVLTKVDISPEPERYMQAAEQLGRSTAQPLPVVCLNAKLADGVAPLLRWCGEGRTAALMGSSGVGKSTIVNSLLGHSVQSTGAVRDDDSKGRHTTTARSLHLLGEGGLLLDSPGIRELQVLNVERGLDDTFEDIQRLAQQCRFANCRHSAEPGCAVTTALAAGDIDSLRLENFRKLRDTDS